MVVPAVIAIVTAEVARIAVIASVVEAGTATDIHPNPCTSSQKKWQG
jgi:hypothetical protein